MGENKWMDEEMGGWTNKWTDKWIGAWMNGVNRTFINLIFNRQWWKPLG